MSLIALITALVTMVVELRVSRGHERELRARGAMVPPDPAYAAMRWVYPGAFVAMAIEGVLFGPPSFAASATGIAVFVLAKLLKVWAIRSLGVLWTFRVFVLPGEPLVTTGPYRWLRHPNYLAVVGELIGMAVTVGARVTGPIAVVSFGYLLRRRIVAEESALQLSRRSS